MEIGAAIVANRQAAEAVEPGHRVFDDPPADAEAAAVRRPAPRQNGSDAAGREPLSVPAGSRRPSRRSAPGCGVASPAAPHRGKGVNQGNELGDVVDVGGRRLRDERDPAGIGDDKVFSSPSRRDRLSSDEPRPQINTRDFAP
jgi:hypothetical protein